MSPEFYKVMHLTGLMFLFFGLGGAVVLKMSKAAFSGPAKSLAFATHGIGWLLMLVGGFGMAGKLGYMAGGIPGWLYAKIAILLLMGGAVVLAKHKGEKGWPLAILFVALGATAAWLALFKPF